MKAIAFIIVVIVVVIVALALADWVRRGLARERERRTPWELQEQSERGKVWLRAVKPGQAPLVIGTPVPFDAEDFEGDIELARAAAEQKVVALNNRRR